MVSIPRILKYVFECDACNREVTAKEANPTSGVVGELSFPDSAHGQRRNYTYYSCREDATHIAKAMRKVVEERKEDVNLRKSRGEPYERNGKPD